MHKIDVISIGRSSVDLYGQQVGGRLEDMGSFSKALGGSPTNTAFGAARLGLSTAVITRVGDEHMGRFIRETLEAGGVNTRGVITDPKRLTSLVILGIRDDKTFPMIFYRTDCADSAICEDDIDEAFIASAKAVLVSGTHFSMQKPADAQRKAIQLAKKHGLRVAFDIDYRPNLWGLAGHGDGEERYVKSDDVTAHLQPILADCDLIVGTEEELHIAGGTEDTLQAIRNIRAVSSALIVCKRGPMGCVAFPDTIPESLEGGIKGPGFPVDVFNVLGAGDAFMGGFLRGWLRNEPLETTCAWANACGAFAVSRLLCSVEYPTFAEMQHFLAHGSKHRSLRFDTELNHIHHATTRRDIGDELMVFAIDHRAQFEEMVDRSEVSRDKIAPFKTLAVIAAARVAQRRPGYGMLLDTTYGRNALFKAEGEGLWLGRPVEKPGSRPLAFDGLRDLGSALNEWPVKQTVKCLAFYNPDDSPEVRLAQDETLLQMMDAARHVGRETMIEIIAGKNGPMYKDTVSTILDHLYGLGIRPDWWKLEPLADRDAWQAVGQVIQAQDALCRGIVVLGLERPDDDLTAAFEAARATPWVKGFAIGRTIFGTIAQDWFSGRINDTMAIDRMAERYTHFCNLWKSSARHS
ncbi:MAG: 5-dehydro-2-deoxygluconokinase [Rhizobiales bacterium]|nr:5-dehydro-2-deoxygluconokinase [Hyphomicrobiales bacterium]